MDKPIIIRSLLELDHTLYTVSFKKTCLAAEELIILTHAAFTPRLNITFQNVLAPAQRETIDEFTHSYSLFPG